MRTQIARELALLSASDWPFMVTRGRTPGYAAERVARHARRLTTLCHALDGGDAAADAALAELSGSGALDAVPLDATAFIDALDGQDVPGR